MKRWKLPWRPSAPPGATARPGTPAARPCGDEIGVEEITITASVTPATDGYAAGFQAGVEAVRMDLELDDGLTVPVLLSEQNAQRVVEATQRIRASREEERASLRPVYNFGGDPGWSPAGDYS